MQGRGQEEERGLPSCRPAAWDPALSSEERAAPGAGRNVTAGAHAGCHAGGLREGGAPKGTCFPTQEQGEVSWEGGSGVEGGYSEGPGGLGWADPWAAVFPAQPLGGSLHARWTRDGSPRPWLLAGARTGSGRGLQRTWSGWPRRAGLGWADEG